MSDNPTVGPGIFYGNTESPAPDLEEITEPADTEASTEEPAEELETEEIETEESTEAEESEDEEAEVFVYEIDGKEYTEDDIKELEQGNLRQADYTRKTQAIAETVREKVDEEVSTLRNNVAELQATIQAEEIDLEKLSDPNSELYDPDEALKQTKLKQKRDKLLADIKSQMGDAGQPSTEELKNEQQKLMEANPHWVNDGKLTDEYNAEMAMLDKFFKANDWTAEEQAAVTRSAYWQAILKAAKYDELQTKKQKIVKKVKKAPVVKKPKGRVQSKADKPKKMTDIMYNS